MKKYLISISLSVFMAVFMVGTAHAHGESSSMGGSTGMMRMMDVMHGQMDNNQAFDCDKATDEKMMEKGEDMMEEMMGHEDHERVEEAMEKDMQDHDSIHMMMGMWSSGCIGDETMNTMMGRYGIPGRLDNGYQGQANWPIMSFGIIIGLVGGWAGSQILSKRKIS